MIQLKNRGISAQKALDCCNNAEDEKELALRFVFGELLAQALTLRTSDSFNQQLVLVPAPLVFPKVPLPPGLPTIRVIPIGRPLLIGWIVLLATSSLGSLVRQLATLEVLTAVLQILDTILETRTCESCIRRKMWRQSRQQRRVRVTIRRRL